MQLSELQARVTEIISDSYYTSAKILEYLNRAVNEIAGGGVSPHGVAKLAPLPDLFKTDTVTTSTSNPYVSLPSDYMRGLFMVFNSDNDELEIYKSFINFVRKTDNMSETGTVDWVCRKGGNIYYQPKPTTANDLTLYYYKTPTDMVNATDEPEGIPGHLQDRLLVNHVCMRIFSEIEQDMDSRGMNTAKHTGLYMVAQDELERFIGAEDKDPEFSKNDTSYIIGE